MKGVEAPPAPPSDVEAEEALVGAILVSPEIALPLAREVGVQPTELYSPKTRNVLTAEFALADAEQAIDNVTVAAWLRSHELLDVVGGSAAVVGLQAGVFVSSHADVYARTIRQAASKRAAIQEAETQLRALKNGHADTSDVLPYLSQRKEFPAPPGPAAFAGIIGEFLSLCEPCVETGNVALAAQFLAVFGGVVGPGPHLLVGATRHDPRLYVLVVGKTGESRKGDGWGVVRETFKRADGTWDGPISGLSTGEGLIARFADPPDTGKERRG